jgi:RloB-like protein
MAKRGKLKDFAKSETEERPVRFRRYQYLFLIVCEDEKTEPAYFEQFKTQIPPDTIYLKSVGTGRDAKGVVERAIIEKEALTLASKKEVDVVWVVFDKDSADENAAKIQRFEDAFKIAKKENMKVAYSNEAFELWLLLHLTDVNSTIPLPRTTIYTVLEEKIRRFDPYKTFIYEHGNPNIVSIISKMGDENKAIIRAKQLLIDQKGRKPIEANPSTKVQELVVELREWIRYYAYVVE